MREVKNGVGKNREKHSEISRTRLDGSFKSPISIVEIIERMKTAPFGRDSRDSTASPATRRNAPHETIETKISLSRATKEKVGR